MKYLRQYIRQTLLTEGAFTPEDLPDNLSIRIRNDGELFDVTMVKKTKGYTKDGSGWIMSSEYSSVGGEIQAYKISNSKTGHCLGAYMVSYSTASSGWGPLLYDIAIELATQNGSGLIADRESVSGDARAVWNYHMTNRSDVTGIQMDNLKNTLTPEEEDNCDQEVSRGYRSGGGSGWQASPLSKIYKKSPASTIEKLRSLGKLVEV